MAQQYFFGGPILTMGDPLYAQALLVEDGIIRAVGTLEEVQAQLSPSAQSIHLQGHTLMPAFLDPHSHFLACAYALLQAPLSECTTQQEVCQALQNFAQLQKVPSGQWVKGSGYDHLTEGTPPDRWMLDQACPNHPVVIQHASGHMGVFNSRALELLGVHQDTPCPQGGVMARNAQGQLTGYMEETAFLSLLQKTPQEDFNQLMEAAQKAQTIYASHGIATVQEGMLMDSMAPLYQALLEQNLLKLDVIAYANPQFQASLPPSPHFRIGGIKIFLDGSPQGCTAWMRQPYLHREDHYCGYPVLSDQAVYDSFAKAQREGLQILAHCNGDQAAEQYLTQMERLVAETGQPMDKLRPVMIHAQLLGIDQIPRLAQLGVIPSFFIAHIFHWGETHVKHFGLDRAAQISPAGAALQAHIPFTFHQDSPVIPPDMIETLWCAVNRLTNTGRVLGADQRISVLDALRAVTIHSAYQYFEEDTKGSLQVGKRGDLVILSQNPLEVPSDQLRELQVLATFKDGLPIYSREPSLA